MMTTSTEVRIWKTEVYRGACRTTYYVRWRVERKSFREPRSTKAHAESFRSDLVAAASRGEAFVIESGLPVSMHRASIDLSWFDFARNYADGKWEHLSGNARRNTAYSLSIATLALLKSNRGKPDDKVLNAALAGWAFNKLQREQKPPADEIASALDWLSSNTRPMSDLSDGTLVRSTLDRLTRNADGSEAAASTVARRRGVLHDALARAVEQHIFGSHPMDGVKWSAPRSDGTIDRRCVANPVQARTLLRAVRDQGRPYKAHGKVGARLVAFFALMYYAGLRPEEAVNVRKHNLSLPEEGWGDLILERSAPVVGRAWANIPGRRDNRPLKHRSDKATRLVPCHPELTAILHDHITEFGTAPDGRLFRALNGGELAESTYYRIWRQARQAVFTPAVAASPLARVPYDLRHACLSTWLNAGVEPTQVAEWAGHSVNVLLTVYAKCLDGQDATNRNRIAQALNP